MIGVVMVVGLATAFAGGKRASPLPIGNVSASALATSGMTLTDASSSMPPANSAVLTSSQALAVAAGDAHVTTKAAEYVHCDDAGNEPPISQDCWAVSLDPFSFHSHGPDGSQSIQATYAVWLIDPASGRVIDRTSGKS